MIAFETVTFVTSPPQQLRLMLSGELGRLLTMYEMEAQCGFIPGTAVAHVKASDMKALWKLFEDVKSRHSGTEGAVGIGGDLMKHVCSPDADVNAVYIRTSRLGILMTGRDGKQSRPPVILFAIFAKLPMKWRAFGESHRGLF